MLWLSGIVEGSWVDSFYSAAMILTGMVFVAFSGAASTWLLGKVEHRVMRWRTA